MNPKEKAEELLRIIYNQMGMPLDCEWKDDCYNKFKDRNGLAKACALIVVDEILRSEPRSPSNVDWDDVGGTHQYYYEAQREEADKYWQEVKEEIKKL